MTKILKQQQQVAAVTAREQQQQGAAGRGVQQRLRNGAMQSVMGVMKMVAEVNNQVSERKVYCHCFGAHPAS
jgi:hypothetical protein